ncbi:putative P-loop containing nucleoside triphosphate hydrolase [Medicago truncatula]|uniref:Putative P-loop containing nucleoside triphosphate hydrolase n=1 Tax=Medicago truncatula TaxID=3880 RepID=A0A396GYY1_MEDTR|nr:putative P-loop containing nucleoside triphosphate hydrolase [Medicago truncatula]
MFSFFCGCLRILKFTDGVQFTCSVSSDVLLSSVDGVQDLSINVDKQMVTYQLPRIVFINSLDYKEADPWEVVDQVNLIRLMDLRSL